VFWLQQQSQTFVTISPTLNYQQIPYFSASKTKLWQLLSQLCHDHRKQGDFITRNAL